MADISVTDFLGSWANNISNKIFKRQSAMLFNGKLTKLLSDPKTYEITKTTQDTFCNGKFTVSTTYKYNDGRYYFYINSNNGTTPISNIEVSVLGGPLNKKSITIYKVTENDGIGYIEYRDNSYSRGKMFGFFIDNDTGVISTYTISYNWVGSNGGAILGVYKSFYDENLIAGVVRVYEKLSYRSNTSSKYYIFTVKASKNDAKYDLWRICEDVTYPDTKNQVNIVSTYNNASKPESSFYACEYTVDNNNVIVTKGASSVACFFPYDLCNKGSDGVVTQSLNTYAIILPSISTVDTFVTFHPITWINSSGNTWIVPEDAPNFTKDGSSILGVYLPKSGGKIIYAITFKPGTYPYSFDWFDTSGCFAVWSFNLDTGSVAKENLTLSEFITSIL